MAATIGIKIANGEFYSILEESSNAKKRLVLTTVHNNQQSVQIDLYKSNAKSMVDALYIGSLVVENIKPRPRGEPSIELTITSTIDGNITADAVYLDTSVHGDHQILTVSLKSMEEDNREYELPDFELEQNEPPPTGLYDKAKVVRQEEEKRKFPWLIVVCAALVLIAIGLAVWLLVFRGKSEPAVTRPPVVQESQAAKTAEAPPPPPPPAPAAPAPAPAAPAPQVIQAPAAAPASQGTTQARRNRPAPPVASYNVPSVIPKEGAPYKIRWGDTLWDIAEAFYRNPWLYPRIARFNNIRNPDLIISGNTIRVPPRN